MVNVETQERNDAIGAKSVFIEAAVWVMNMLEWLECKGELFVERDWMGQTAVVVDDLRLNLRPLFVFCPYHCPYHRRYHASHSRYSKRSVSDFHEFSISARLREWFVALSILLSRRLDNACISTYGRTLHPETSCYQTKSWEWWGNKGCPLYKSNAAD